MYVHPATGEAVFSVTTIIKNGIPKNGLADWYANKAARYAVDNWDHLSEYPPEARYDQIRLAAERERDSAASKGDDIHRQMELFTDDPKGNPHLIQWQRFLQVSGFEVTHREVTLWNFAHEYAGTADWIARTPQGQYCIGDTKTGNSIRPNYALQIEALVSCTTIVHPDGTEEQAPYFDFGGILHLRPKSWWWYNLSDTRTCARNWDAYMAAKTVAEWGAVHPDMVLGKQRWNADNWGEA